MQSIWLTIIVCLTVSAPLMGQETKPQKHLDDVLNAWEKKMKGIETFSTKVTRTEQSPLTKLKTSYVGEAAFMKPNLGRVDLTREDEIGKKDAEKIDWQRVICDGKFVYIYSPKDRTISVSNLDDLRRDAQNKRKGFIEQLSGAFARLFTDNWILAILKGMPIDKLKERFDVVLTKESDWYVYLLIKPKSKDDKENFTAAQLALWAKNPNPEGQPDLTMLTCRFWLRQPNGMEITYSFENMQPNAKLTPKDFAPKRIDGYELKETAPAPKP